MTVDPTTETGPSRRNVLCGLVVALVAPGTVVAACSSGDDSGGDSGDTGSGGGTTGGGAAPTGGGGTSGGGGQGIAALADVPEGGGLVVDYPDGKLLIVQPAPGEVKAYNAACTHRGTTVNPPADGLITCPNHGSQFDPASGDVRNGPATRPLVEVPVMVESGQVMLA